MLLFRSYLIHNFSYSKSLNSFDLADLSKCWLSGITCRRLFRLFFFSLL